MVVIGTVKEGFDDRRGGRSNIPLELYSDTPFEQMQEPAILTINGVYFPPYDNRLGEYRVVDAPQGVREALRLAGYRIDGL